MTESGEPTAATRRLERERRARLEAESIAEKATRQLYDTVQELTRSTRLAGLLGEVAVRANEASSVAEAMNAVLQLVCDFTGWPVGHALGPGEKPGTLVSLGIWHLPGSEEYASFAASSSATEFTAGTGLPGRVLQLGEPCWIADLQTDPNFPRHQAALACGLASGFALPVLIRSETAGVLEFFATTPAEPDDVVLRVAGFIGAQLGRVLERQLAEERLRHLALYDDLTGLPNRLLLMDRLGASLRHSVRTGTPVNVLYLDIDDFKIINDSQGHAAGDAVLRALAARLKDAVRSTDTIGRAAPSTVARLGGDEFAIVLEDCADPILVARRIEQLLRTPLEISDGQIFLSVSVGTAPADERDLASGGEDLLAKANVAMHEAKRTGKGHCETFQPQMYARARRQHQLGEDLHRAVTNGDFTIAYQPVVSFSEQRVVGAEALLRWQHPTLGMIPPDEFISRAEETGLIVPIGKWVLAEACRQAAEWRKTDPDFTVAVNVSGRQLREADFPRVVLETLERTQLPARNLCLEMTESMLMEHDDHAITLLGQLRAQDVHLAIDDFGTGYSSLGALRRLPADQLKIDRSFVRSLPHDDDAGTIAWAVVRLGHTLGMSVLAEGVETDAQAELLLSIGCDYAQGYLYSKPCDAEHFEAHLLEGARRIGESS